MKHISYHIIFISYNAIVKKYIYNREAFKKECVMVILKIF